MKNSAVHIFGLQGCEKCDSVSTKLKSLHIPYEFTDCSGYKEVCHELELLTGAIDFPIIVVGEVVLCLVLNYNPQVNKRVLKNGQTCIDCLSLHELLGKTVDEYKKHYN